MAMVPAFVNPVFPKAKQPDDVPGDIIPDAGFSNAPLAEVMVPVPVIVPLFVMVPVAVQLMILAAPTVRVPLLVRVPEMETGISLLCMNAPPLLMVSVLSALIVTGAPWLVLGIVNVPEMERLVPL